MDLVGSRGPSEPDEGEEAEDMRLHARAMQLKEDLIRIGNAVMTQGDHKAIGPALYLAPGTWYLVPGTWYLVLGTWYLVPDTLHIGYQIMRYWLPNHGHMNYQTMAY